MRWARILAFKAIGQDMLGDKPSARASAKRALQIDPNSAIAKEVLERIK